MISGSINPQTRIGWRWKHFAALFPASLPTLTTTPTTPGTTSSSSRAATTTHPATSATTTTTTIAPPPPTSPTMAVRKPHLPLLIDAFPAPPSFIPPTPSPGVSYNPPPSRPPSSPLPPVPGPSRITEADTLQLLRLSSRGNRSRPSSKYSVASRDSIISTSSAHSYYSSNYSSRPSPRVPSFSDRGSNPSSPISPRRPSFAFSIDEERDGILPPSILPRDVVSPMLPLSEDDDNAGDDSSQRRHSQHHQANESISSINMRDILGAVSGAEEDEVPASSKLNASPLPRPEAKALPSTSSHSYKSSLAYLKFDELPPPEPTTPSKPSHTKSDSLTLADLASSSTTTLRSLAVSPPQASTPKASVAARRYPPSLSATMPPLRSPSPDIDTIIQSTPRPSKLSAARSFTSSHDQRKNVNSVRSVRSMRSFRSTTDEFGATPMRLSKTMGRKKSSAFDQDDSLNYIVEGEWKRSGQDDEKRIRELEKELENSGSDSDDSSIDLHTPLPHLMVRHGLLSPNSKLLPQSRSNTPYAADGRPGSTMSTFSTVTKSGVIKDERDTLTRRVRHRDGKLLRGGIGLTTGLGWSDSEDEDSPSPLTKRLSTLPLSSRSSSSSSRPHPLSRSYSSGTLNSTYLEEDDEYDEAADEWGAIQARKTCMSNPPTAWSRKMSGASASARTSYASSGGRLSVASSNGRMSMASNGSVMSEDTRASLDRQRTTRAPSASSVESGSNNEIRTLSSGSTLSIPMPVTPKTDRAPSIPSSLPSKKVLTGKDKALPPLPGGLSKMPSRVNLSASQGPPSTKSTSTKPSSMKQSFPRARTFSTTSSSASSHSVVGVPTPSAPAHVRPLQLPRQIRTAAGDRPAVPVPSITSRAMRKASLPTSSVTPPTSSPSRSLSTHDKPRPRTGTGMVYKSSSNASKLRPPMPLQSTSLSTSSIGRPRPLAKPTVI